MKIKHGSSLFSPEMHNIWEEFIHKTPYSLVVNKMSDIFGQWWSIFESKSKKVRRNHYSLLPRAQQLALRQSFLEDGWCELFCQNHIDHLLDHIKNIYNIDLFDMRIKVLKYHRVFLVEQHIWEDIEKMILEYEPLFDSNILFGGLKIQSWGTKKRFFRITAQQKGRIDA